MKTTCPHCGKSFDVGYKDVMNWIERNPNLRKAVGSLIGRINGARANPKNKARTREQCQAAAAARWKGHVKKPKGINPADLEG